MARAKLPVINVAEKGCGVCPFADLIHKKCEAWIYMPMPLARDYRDEKPRVDKVPDNCPMRHFDMSFEFPEAV
jgi:hypothetical protein